MNVFKNRKILLVAIAVLCITSNQTSFGQTHKTEASQSSGASEHVNRRADLANKGQYDEAIIEFTKAIELAPTDVTGYFERGQTEVMTKQNEAAVADLDKAIALKPDDATLY